MTPEPVASQLLRNLKLTIEYDGTDFHGWQAQENVRTVEGVLSQALQGLLKEGAELHAASRTDQGVHARGQVVSFLTTTRIPAGRFPAALNGMLPWDVRVRKAEEADPAFNARFSAVGKHYRYRLDRGETDSPFLSRFALHYPGRLDVKAMREAARLMAGTHDFASFQCVSKRRLASTVRTVYDVRVGEEGRFLWFDVWGKSFLYKMVRTMAGTLLEVGRGKWSPERIPALLSSVSRAAAGPTCPGNGLCLMAVYYDLDRLEGALQGSSPVPSELGPPLEGEGGGGKG